MTTIKRSIGVVSNEIKDIIWDVLDVFSDSKWCGAVSEEYDGWTTNWAGEELQKQVFQRNDNQAFDKLESPN